MRSKMKFDFFFEDRGGEGPLALYFQEGPYGDAIEAVEGSGVGFFNEEGKLLAAQFDKVLASSDHQILRFKNRTFIEVSVLKAKPKLLAVQLLPSSKSVA